MKYFIILVSVHYVPLTSIFSTRVITGAKSTPDLNKLLERKQAGRMYLDSLPERGNLDKTPYRR
jgi:hypothetical protein